MLRPPQASSTPSSGDRPRLRPPCQEERAEKPTGTRHRGVLSAGPEEGAGMRGDVCQVQGWREGPEGRALPQPSPGRPSTRNSSVSPSAASGSPSPEPPALTPLSPQASAPSRGLRAQQEGTHCGSRSSRPGPARRSRPCTRRRSGHTRGACRSTGRCPVGRAKVGLGREGCPTHLPRQPQHLALRLTSWHSAAPPSVPLGSQLQPAGGEGQA